MKDPVLTWEEKRLESNGTTWLECRHKIGQFSVEGTPQRKYYVSWTPPGSSKSVIVIRGQVNQFEAKKATERFINGVLRRTKGGTEIPHF